MGTYSPAINYGQPVARGAGWVGDLGMLPLPTAPLGILEAALDPGSQGIPAHISLFG